MKNGKMSSRKTMLTQRVTTAAGAALFLSLGAVGLHAQIVAVESTFNPGGTYYSLPPDQTYGWRFSVGDTPLSVTQLGYFDAGLDGLMDSHRVGIWDSAGTLLTQATVPAGTEGTLVSAYRFTLAAPARLEANTTYFIGGLSASASDVIIAFDSPQTYASEIAYQTATYSQLTGFASPDTAYSASHGVFGPNLQFTAVPEPHHYAMLSGFGLAGFFLVRRKLRGQD